MRIVHLITRLIVGGAQENTLLSCLGQHRLGHEVTLITGPPLGPEGSLLDVARAGGYRVEVLDDLRRALLPAHDLRAFLRLVRRLRELRPDIVHTHSSKAGILGRWAAHRAGLRGIVHTIHGLAFTASTSPLVNAFYRQAERITAPITDRIVCVADEMARQSLAAGVGRRPQYVTVYSGMETAPFLSPPVPPCQMRRQLGIADHHVVVGTIARLFHLKGHEDLLALAPDLCRQFPNLRFLWVGDGILRRDYESQISNLGLSDRFILTGLVPPSQIPQLAAAMDILVHPSRREGLARALVQGSLAGKPVIGYDVDGNREAMEHGRGGYVIKMFHVEHFGKVLGDLLRDADLRRRMGEAGRQFALRRFDVQVMVSALERVYQQMRPR